MRALLIMLLLALPVPSSAQAMSDTPEQRAALAKDLGDIEAPNIRRAMADMMDALEQNVPLDQRPRFRTHLESLITYDTVRRSSDSAVAKNMTADELTALIAFYRSPIGHEVMLKLPLLARDTGALIQSLVEQALRQLPTDSEPLSYTPL
jgi:hypothetical protein